MLKNFSLLSEIPSPSDTADLVRTKMTRDYLDDDELFSLCCEIVFERSILMSFGLGKSLDHIRKVFNCLRSELETLQELADDPGVTEIMVNGHEKIFVEKNGRIEKVPYSLDSKQQLFSIIQRLAARVGREINDLNPIVDARLADGSRINAVNDNIAIDGPILTIRKFGGLKIGMDDLISSDGITEEAAVFLSKAVRTGANIFVSGGTSSGKTTFLNILSDCIPPDERIIVIEDSAELQIRNHENVVRMEAKVPNSQGRGGVSIRELIKASLRMRPDRIIVGEVRGDEVIDMLAAMSTGHDGSLSTGHANSPRGMLGRLETMHIAGSSFPLAAVRNQIADAIDLVVQLKRFRDGSRKVVEITEVCGVSNGEIQLNALFERVGNGKLERTENPVRNGSKLGDIQGICSVGN